MAARQVQLLAWANILLILSLHPITAFRVMEAQSVATGLQETQELVQELQRTLQEDAQASELAAEANGTQAYIGETFASCGQRKRDFERRVEKVKARRDKALAADGRVSAVDSVWVLLKARVMVKTLTVAQKQGCDWGDSVDTSTLRTLVAETAPKTPCFEATARTLEGAREADAEGQRAGFVEAMGIFLSEDCKPVAPERHSATEVDSEFNATEKEVDEGAEELAYDAGVYQEQELAELRRSLAAGKGAAGGSLLQAGGGGRAGLAALRVQRGADAMLAFGRSLLQAGERGVSADVDSLVAKFFAWMFLGVFLVMFCLIFHGFLLLVIGLIMCLLKIAIVAFLRYFGSGAWDSDFEGCMKFWLGAIKYQAHPGGGDFAVVQCASSIIRGWTN
mmetsp:Transcript_61663/g.198654  ORF Transcript_61663/g.198654 Transcript_61663/m.198654 type:complete len:393 (-) Transcript_61663:144-1322(-)